MELSTSPVKTCNLIVNVKKNKKWPLYLNYLYFWDNSSKRSFVQCCSSAGCWNRVMRTSEWKESHSYSSGRRYSTSKVHQALSKSYTSLILCITTWNTRKTWNLKQYKVLSCKEVAFFAMSVAMPVLKNESEFATE